MAVTGGDALEQRSATVVAGVACRDTLAGAEVMAAAWSSGHRQWWRCLGAPVNGGDDTLSNGLQWPWRRNGQCQQVWSCGWQ
uniref:Uncharacterized protein n=1 Tax=Oryza brachyantha TaxID=4533 RepID=J3MYQ1_ORYBR